MSDKAEHKSFGTPDETRTFSNGEHNAGLADPSASAHAVASGRRDHARPAVGFTGLTW
jgi:hypothetical protein